MSYWTDLEKLTIQRRGVIFNDFTHSLVQVNLPKTYFMVSAAPLNQGLLIHNSPIWKISTTEIRPDGDNSIVPMLEWVDITKIHISALSSFAVGLPLVTALGPTISDLELQWRPRCSMKQFDELVTCPVFYVRNPMMLNVDTAWNEQQPAS